MQKTLLILIASFISVKSFALDRYTVANLVKQLKPAVVTITHGSKGFGREQSVASGMVVSADGFVATNYHAVEGADIVDIKFNNNKNYKAKVINFDKKTDLAILKIQGYNAFPFVSFGNSDQVQVGELVFAIGSPYGLEHSVSMGIISGKNRAETGKYQDFLQTDAAINPGNSGGPLFNLDGRLIGINTAGLRPGGGNSGIGFAIPSNLVSKVIADLKNNKTVQRAGLAIEVTNITASLKQRLHLDTDNGAIIHKIYRSSPLIVKGLRVGDTVVQFNGQYIQNANQLQKLMNNSRVGQVVRIKFMRGRKIYGVNVKMIKEV